MPSSLVSTMDLHVQRLTAAQRALAIPEILNNIFAQKSQNDPYFHFTESEQCDLLRWALVSKPWYGEAIRLLWAHPMGPMDLLMANIPPDRRQYYANFITWARVIRQARSQDNHFEDGGPLHGLIFPKLTKLFVSLFTTDLFVIPVDHPKDWARDMHFKRREPKFAEECHLDSIFQILSNFIPGIDELFLRYEGPMSNLAGLVQLTKKGGALPADNTHWYIEKAPDPSTDEENSFNFFEEPEVEEVVDTWGESTWADTYLCQFDTAGLQWIPANWKTVKARIV